MKRKAFDETVLATCQDFATLEDDEDVNDPSKLVIVAATGHVFCFPAKEFFVHQGRELYHGCTPDTRDMDLVKIYIGGGVGLIHLTDFHEMKRMFYSEGRRIFHLKQERVLPKTFSDTAQYNMVGANHCNAGSTMTVYAVSTCVGRKCKYQKSSRFIMGSNTHKRALMRGIKKKPLVVEFSDQIDLAWLLPAKDTIAVLNLRQAPSVDSLHLLPRFKALRVLYLWNDGNVPITLPEGIEVLETFHPESVTNLAALGKVVVTYLSDVVPELPVGLPRTIKFYDLLPDMT
ncbi:hypothetical protein SARC_00073 [Sphaeroforma arctica JP610]|uniref:Uncharacterized protein n=1 Tax=Sphaeroforma arctica JP610 TaxID=667725 RepID=A0A0L0GG63_9EUKA|nr:hypothetical protein SARC_00073 [Sphaeroforma arctica JP610]KNC87816.1 hypothetical protein SARC_00073 [Sphaeroforma arctica JP610]|eukprot:XP_014161718.1 hypothetical protein SARC_00073 [Sphaeroforma arctica JP610]